MRGEQVYAAVHDWAVKGSPPLARGTEKFLHLFAHTLRITPACAGNSDIYRFAPGDAEDHPRLRGEQSWWGDEVTPAQGSPPLARGTVIMSSLYAPGA